jgi:ankyrin repeat protein
LDQTDKHGRTPLHDAALAGMTEAATALVRHGANVAVADEFHSTPLHAAAAARSADVVAMLLNARAPGRRRRRLRAHSRCTKRPVSARSRSWRCSSDAGANAAVADAYGGTPLHIAARLGAEPVVELLMSRGADVYARTNTTQRTPIDEAKQAGHEQLASLMASGSAAGAIPASATIHPQMQSKNVARMLSQ